MENESFQLSSDFIGQKKQLVTGMNCLETVIA